MDKSVPTRFLFCGDEHEQDPVFAIKCIHVLKMGVVLKFSPSALSGMERLGILHKKHVLRILN